MNHITPEEKRFFKKIWKFSEMVCGDTFADMVKKGSFQVMANRVSEKALLMAPTELKEKLSSRIYMAFYKIIEAVSKNADRPYKERKQAVMDAKKQYLLNIAQK